MGDVTAEQPRDWLEFFKEYTYPPIKTNLDDDEEVEIEETGLACALDINLTDLAGGLLENFFADAWDIFSHDFNLNSCKDDEEKREPVLKQFIEANKQAKYEEFYQEELK